MPTIAPIDTLSRDDLLNLAQQHGEHCVSIYLPTHRATRDTRQDPIRFRNLLGQAEEQLIAAGVRAPEARQMLEAERSLIDDPEFWRHQADGLAIFASESGSRHFRLPIRFGELVAVGERFHLKPLFPALTGDGLFYALAISQGQARLFRCTRDSFEEVDSPRLPDGQEVILRYIEEQKQLQWHTQTGYSPKGRAAMFHGQGAPERDDKERIFEYFRLVARALHAIIGDQKTPVVFVGVDYLFPIFQEANRKFVNLLDDFVAGNADEHRVDPRAIHEAASILIQPHFDAARRKGAELYRHTAGVEPHRASNDLADIVRAAHDGRVTLAFTALDVQRWGRYDPATGEVEFHQKQQPGDDDLLDLITIHTFIHGGTPFVVPRSDMPDRADAVAVTRF